MGKPQHHAPAQQMLSPALVTKERHLSAACSCRDAIDGYFWGTRPLF